MDAMRWTLACLLCLVWLAGCAPEAPATESTSSADGSKAKLSKIVLALVPSDDNEQQLEGFEPIKKKLEASLGVPVEMYQVTDYAGVIEGMKANRIDVAWYGPLSYVIAEREAGAEAFAITEDPEGTSTYYSMILVKAASPYKALADLKGKSMALVDPASTSGSLVPQHLVKSETGSAAKEFFRQVIYAGSHDAAILAVRNGSVDACGTNNLTFDRMKEKGIVKEGDLREIKRSEALPQSPLAYRKSLPEDTKAKIKETFMEMDKSLAGMDVAGIGKIKRFIPAGPEMFAPIGKLADDLALSRDEMLK